jgi:adenine-specific DNA methylase
MTPLKPLLIEHWLPIQAIGAESQRENSTGLHPAPNRLHVWWARRPLIASRAAILASVLPQWSEDFPAALQEKFPSEEIYKQWITFLIGVRGDPIKGRKLMAWAKGKGIKLDFNPYGGAPRAFSVSPSAEDLQTMGDLLEWTWGKRSLSVLDPFSGGGSIPFESLRYGFNTYANDLNPVASVILKSTLDYPARYGALLADDIRKWGNEWSKRVKEKLTPYFPKQPNESIFAYLWARTVACPTTGKLVPLSPNWWLSSGEKSVAVRMTCESKMDVPYFDIVTGADAKAIKPEIGTVSNGDGRSPWTGETIDGDYIKSEAQSGRMGSVLYAVINKRRGGFDYRVPTAEDVLAFEKTNEELKKRRNKWESNGILPIEEIGISNYDRGHRLYGIYRWSEFFSNRQLFSLAIYLETLKEIFELIDSQYDPEKALAIKTFLAITFDKAVVYNTTACRFDQSRGIRSIFDKHNFAFVWSYAEFDASANLLTWALGSVIEAYQELAKISSPVASLISKAKFNAPQITLGSANSLPHIPDASIDNITVDPPYYDNVQYAELSDFFYVWLKRSVGHLYPDFFRDELTNKDDEAVANPARFVSMGKKKKELAEQDYENKMTAAFREMYRVLRPEGSLTVMFTHKKVEAWDTLASALINAGFVIKASWPVHTESEHSLHQAKKNAAASTILLVCRKREGLPSTVDGSSSGEATWWDDLAPRVREAARQKAEEFSAQGISGVDLYISTFGPALSIISEHWPVLTSEVDPKTDQPKPLRPETALDLAREEVVRLRKQGLLAGRDVRFDPVTDWVLMAWDAFHAEEFPYDEGRKLAIALGVDMDSLIMKSKRLAIKKSNSVVMQVPIKRSKKDMVDPDATSFEHWIDAAHTAMLVYEEDGAGACDVFLRKANLKTDNTFKALLQSMINAIPRARIKGKFARPEAETLENIRLAFFPELTVPVEEEPSMPVASQLGLFGEAVEVDEEESDEGEE